MDYIIVEDLLTDEISSLKLKLLAGKEGLLNKICNPRIQKPGLAISGYFQQLHSQRVQVLGQTEINYLNTLSKEDLEKRLENFCKLPISCIIITTNLTPPDELFKFCDLQNIPLMVTEFPSSTLISRISSYMEEKLAPEIYLHGVFVVVYGVGVMILGPSGIGKSECALELVVRGHRLVSDDVIKVKLYPSEKIVGSSPDLSRHYIEVRGLGVLNIKDLFGVAAVRNKKQVELVIKLKPLDSMEDCERLGLDEQTINILGVDLPLIDIPVAPGRNLAVIVEVAARNQLLKQKGYFAARTLNDALTNRLTEKKDYLNKIKSNLKNKD